MDSVILFWSIPVLTIVACFASFFAQILYVKVYERYIAFEPSAEFKVSLLQHAGKFLILTTSLMLGPIFLWAQGLSHSSEFAFLIGIAIAFLASWISRSLFSLFIYRYIQMHPGLIRGQTIFKAPVAQILNASMVMQQVILVAILTFFIPSTPFMSGALVGLSILALAHYFSKKTVPIA